MKNEDFQKPEGFQKLYFFLLLLCVLLFFIPAHVSSLDEADNLSYPNRYGFSPLLPGFFYTVSDISAPTVYTASAWEKGVQMLAIKTVIQKPKHFIKNLRMWNWICLGFGCASITSIILTPLLKDEASGIFAMTTHGLWAISDIFLALSYYNLQKSLKAYGFSSFWANVGMIGAIGVVLSAVLTINIGATLFGNFNQDMMMLTISLAAATDLLGIGTIVYTFLYDSFLYPGG
ncbi:MAG: hypothetical protein JXJ04_25700 [Spirochaetales bacterium]|nr:hypothetical protein [Spirochaetales bacterium]